MNDTEYKSYALKEYGVEITLYGYDCPKSQSRRHHFENHGDRLWCNKCAKTVLTNVTKTFYYESGTTN